MRRRTFAASLGAAAVAAAAVPAQASAKTSGRCEDAYTWRTAVVNGGGFVPGIVFNETEADVIYARTDIGGLYRWQEATQTWLPLLDWVGWDNWGWTGVVSVATDPVETNRVYAAVGTYTNEWDTTTGAVVYSDDYGATWGAAELPFKQGGNMPGRGMGERLAVDPTDNAVVYLGTPNGNGLWRSNDHGRTWAKVEAFPNAGNFVQDPSNEYSDDNQGVIWVEFDQAGGRIFVGVADPADPLYVSEDRGQTWQPVPGAAAIGAVDGNRTIPKQAAIDHENGHLFIVTSWDPGPYNGGPATGRGGAVWRLDLATGEWTDVTPTYSPVGKFPGFGGITVDRRRPGTLMAATQNLWGPDEVIYRSTDSGATWETSWDYVGDPEGSPGRADRFDLDASGSEWLSFGNVDNGPQYAIKHGWMIDALSIDPHNSDRIMWGTGATIWGTEQLTAWDAQGPLVGEDEAGNEVALPIERFTVAVRAEGVEETAVQDIAALGGTVVTAMGDLGGFVQTDLGRAGVQIRKPDWSSGRGMDFAALNPDIVVGTGDVHGDVDGHVGVSTDRGASWLTTTRLDGVAGGANAGSVAVSADGTVIVWTPGDGTTAPVFSTDLGQTWTPVDGLPAGAKVRADRVDPNRLYAYVSGKFYASGNGGLSFAETGASGLPPTGDVDFRAVPGKRGHLWLAGGNDPDVVDPLYGMWRSTDGGKSWTRIRDFEAADAVGFGKSQGRRGYPAVFVSAKANGVRGIWRSLDEGRNWQRINDDAHQWGWTGKAISGDPEVYGRVYIATNGRGLIYGDIAD